VLGSRKDGSKSPRFFCESCNAEVPKEAKNCPGCGKRFASVRCPACGFTGEEALFKGGCPACGYSSGVSAESGGKGRNSARKSSAEPLPFWVYALTAAAFTGVLAALFFSFF